MLPQRYFCNRVYSIVTELRRKVTTAEACEKFSIEKLSIAAENVAVLNDFIIEDFDSADCQTNSTFRLHSAAKVSGFGKFLTSFFARLFLGTELVFTLVK